MPKSCLTVASLLAVLATTSGLAQTADELNLQRLPSVDQSAQVPQVPSLQAPGPAVGQTLITDEPIRIEGQPDPPAVATLGDFLGYRYESSSLEWIVGGGDQFGMFSAVWDHYQKSGIQSGIGVGMGFHFLDGPVQTDMPSRVFDFSIAYQIRQQFGPLKFDLSAAVMASSDFEGSAREGIRFPSHAVGFLNVAPATDLVFGIDYVDRGDIRLLPVVGLIWTPNPRMRYELVFPRPRAVFPLTDHQRLYVSGELGGGSWAVERMGVGNDLATYRDLRACIGVESVQDEGSRWAFEIGYLFDRRLEFSSGIGDMHLDDAVMLRLVTAF
jgi:hypothetical protein